MLGRSARDKVTCGLRVAVLQLDLLVWLEVPREPRLAACGLSPDPIAQDVSLVGISLNLNALP